MVFIHRGQSTHSPLQAPHNRLWTYRKTLASRIHQYHCDGLLAVMVSMTCLLSTPTWFSVSNHGHFPWQCARNRRLDAICRYYPPYESVNQRAMTSDPRRITDTSAMSPRVLMYWARQHADGPDADSHTKLRQASTSREYRFSQRLDCSTSTILLANIRHQLKTQ